MGQTLYDKLWDSHVVHVEEDGTALLYIDRHLVHEVTSPQAYEGLRAAGRKPWRIDSVVATADHNTPTTDWNEGIEGVRDPLAKLQITTLDANMREFGAKVYFPYLDKRQGIVHVIGPEQGATLPGMTVVCGDSHTSTHGAFGCLAHGIGTSEVEHVLATQCLTARKMKNMRVNVEGPLGRGVTAKDVALAIIGRIGTAGGTGCAVEFAGSAIRALSMEGRMTVCNMAIEAGARAGMIAVDDTTLQYLKGRQFAPKGRDWDQAVVYWRTLKSDPDAKFDREVTLDAREIKPHVTWGTSPEMVVSVEDTVPDPEREKDSQRREGMERALVYMGLKPQAAHHRHQDRQGVHRLVHQLAHRGPARRGRGGERQAHRRQRARRARRAGLGPGEGAGGEGRPRSRVPRRRLRVARAGLLDVPRHEPRPARGRRALRLDLEPQLRGPAGRRAAARTSSARRWPRRRRSPGHFVDVRRWS